MNTKQTYAVAAACGLLAAVFAFFWFSGKERALEEMSAPSPALVAARYVPSGTRIEKDMVEVKQVPRAFIQPGALKSFEEAEGQVALAPLAPGEQVLANKLTVTGVALALAVPPGKRAVTLAVDPAGGVAGLLKPGDLVDVLATVEDGNTFKTAVLVQAAPVLAVGRNFSAQPVKSDGALFGDSQADTVTIAASLFESQQLTHIEQTGRIKLVLRGPGDRERIPLPAVSGNQALKSSAGSGEEELKKR